MNGLEIQGAHAQILPTGMNQPKTRLTAGTDNERPAGVHSQPKTTEEVLIATRIISSRVGAREIVAELLRDHKIVALDCKGPGDEIALIMLATCFGQCYIFDMYVCPKMMTEGRLRDLIESRNVVKVMHDCHTASDLLYQEFRVRLCNVFDTMCAYNIIEAQSSHHYLVKYFDKPVRLNLVSSVYGRCLLNLTKDAMERLQWQNPKFWAMRPLSDKVIDFLARNVLCLVPESHESMMRAINPVMKPFLDRVTIIKLQPLTIDRKENSLEASTVELCRQWQDIVEKVLIQNGNDGSNPSSNVNQKNNRATPKTSSTPADGTTGNTAADGNKKNSITPSVTRCYKRKNPATERSSSTTNSGLARPVEPSGTDSSSRTVEYNGNEGMHRPKRMRRSSPGRQRVSPNNDSNLQNMNSNKEEIVSDASSFLPDETQSMPDLIGGSGIPCDRVVKKVRPAMQCVHLSFEDLTPVGVLFEDEGEEKAEEDEDEDDQDYEEEVDEDDEEEWWGQ